MSCSFAARDLHDQNVIDYGAGKRPLPSQHHRNFSRSSHTSAGTYAFVHLNYEFTHQPEYAQSHGI